MRQYNSELKDITLDVAEIQGYINDYKAKKKFTDFSAKLDLGLFLEVYRNYVKVHPGWETHVFVFMSEVIHGNAVPFKTRIEPKKGGWVTLTRAQQWGIIMATIYGTDYHFLNTSSVANLIELASYTDDSYGNELASFILRDVIHVNYFKENLYRTIAEQLMASEIFNDWSPISDAYHICLTKHTYFENKLNGNKTPMRKLLPDNFLMRVSAAYADAIAEATSLPRLPAEIYRALTYTINENIDDILNSIRLNLP